MAFGIIDEKDLREGTAKELTEEHFKKGSVVYIKEENVFHRMKLNLLDLMIYGKGLRKYLTQKGRNHQLFIRKNKPFKDFTE